MVVVVVVVVSCMFCMDFLNKSTTCLHFRTSCPLWMYHQGFHSEQSDERERAVKWWASSMYMDNVVSSVAFRNVFVGPHFWQIWWRIFCGEGVWVGQLMRSCLLGLRRSGNVGVPLTPAWHSTCALVVSRWVITFLVSVLCEPLMVNPSHSFMTSYCSCSTSPRNPHSRVAVAAVVGEYGVWIYWSWDLNYAC
jgi:hypothetical protein